MQFFSEHIVTSFSILAKTKKVWKFKSPPAEFPKKTKSQRKVKISSSKNGTEANLLDFYVNFINKKGVQICLDCGKCGGTSVDKTLGPVVRRLSTRKDDKYIGNMHYDWSYFELFEKDSVEPIILLRDPIER